MRGNLATSNGGALYTQESTAVQLTKSTFTNATGLSAGRLVSVVNGSLEAENCTFYDNSSLGPLGIVAAGTGKAAFLRAKNLTLSGTDPSGIQAHAQSGALVSDARAEYSGTIVQHPLGFRDRRRHGGVVRLQHQLRFHRQPRGREDRRRSERAT
jgi:predicted outer membrane repeat protein